MHSGAKMPGYEYGVPLINKCSIDNESEGLDAFLELYTCVRVRVRERHFRAIKREVGINLIINARDSSSGNTSEGWLTIATRVCAFAYQVRMC